MSDSDKILDEQKSSFGGHDRPWGGARQILGGKLPPKEAQMTPLIGSVAYYSGIFVFLLNNFVYEIHVLIFLGQVIFLL